MAPHGMVRRFSSFRGDNSWINFASVVFPVPVSPTRRRVTSWAAIMTTSSSISAIAGDEVRHVTVFPRTTFGTRSPSADSNNARPNSTSISCANWARSSGR